MEDQARKDGLSCEVRPYPVVTSKHAAAITKSSLTEGEGFEGSESTGDDSESDGEHTE